MKAILLVKKHHNRMLLQIKNYSNYIIENFAIQHVNLLLEADLEVKYFFIFNYL
jgi:hypothetical protein